jgi:hypothetical protein
MFRAFFSFRNFFLLRFIAREIRADHSARRHSCECGNPLGATRRPAPWIPAFAGMTLLFFFNSFAWPKDVEGFAYEQIAISPTAPLRFKIAFWKDPDLPPRTRPSGDKLRLFARRLIAELGPDLAASGFGDLTISLIEDYDQLWDERWRVGFDLIECDPAVFVALRTFFQGQAEEDPYELLVEEEPLDPPPSTATIWVRKDSEINDLAALKRRHVAIVSKYCLLGGAIQKARLSLDLQESLEQGLATECGSVSDAILRLITGVATDKPIEAAFLPLNSPGFRAAARDLGLKTPDDLPIRVLATFEEEPIPGYPLLVRQNLLQLHPDLKEKLRQFFLGESALGDKAPYRWKEPSVERMKEISKELDSLLPRAESKP